MYVCVSVCLCVCVTLYIGRSNGGGVQCILYCAMPSAISSIAPEGAVSSYPMNHLLMLRSMKQEHALICMYAQSPRVEGIHIRQITNAYVTLN